VRAPQADHGRTAHSAPQVEVERALVCRGDVPARRAETRHHQGVATLLENIRDGLAAIEGWLSMLHELPLLKN
jgi:hypothetical protein